MESQLINISEEEEEEEIFIRRHERMKGEKKPDDNKRPWADLPSDVLNFIFSHLLGFDCIRFRLTCKEWQLAVNSPLIPPSMIQLEDDLSTQHFPLLMFSSKPTSHGVFDFFHPVTNETYTMHIPELTNCRFLCSRYGWLLMSRSTHSFFFYSPFIPNSTINLPDLVHGNSRCISMSFSAPPTSPDCIVFARNYRSTKFYTCCRGENRWSTANYIQPFKAFNYCTPVFYKDEKGRLGTSDMKELVLDYDGNSPSLKDLPKLKEPNLPDTVSHYNSYIAECDGEFVSVFVDSTEGFPVHVFKLDWSAGMEWVTVKNLGYRTMFIHETTGCLLVPAAKAIYQNKIYFPNFRNKKGCRHHVTKDKACVFYSLETGKYHASGCDLSGEDTNDMEVLPNSVWIEPYVNITHD